MIFVLTTYLIIYILIYKLNFIIYIYIIIEMSRISNNLNSGSSKFGILECDAIFIANKRLVYFISVILIFKFYKLELLIS